MTKEVDITGKKFGKLTAVKKIDSRYWLFRCDCGKEKKIKKTNVVCGITKSCGCLWYKEVALGNRKHGMSKTRLYECWRDMRNRCYLKTRYDYKRYGGRGIVVCDEWKNKFESFYDWAINNGYKDNLTLDRIDVNGNYCPKNCRWSTKKEQATNRRTTVMIEYNGETHSKKDWAIKFGKPSWEWYNRLKKYNPKEVLDIWSKEGGVI